MSIGPEQANSGRDLPLEERCLEALHLVVDPELGSDIVDLGMVRGVTASDGAVTVAIALTIAGCPLRDQIRRDVENAVSPLAGVDSVTVSTSEMTKDERSELMSRARKNAQDRALATAISPNARVLAVVSGKGGVGKSSVTVNLAVALAATGATVGLLDADIWGFSVPRMLGVEGSLEAHGGKILPLEKKVGAGLIRVVSMGFLSNEDDAIMWRGLVLNRAVQHFLEDVVWGELDYLLVDMPPGTGDVQMGLARMLPHTELLVVTTPALAAQKVAGRAADMARRGHLRIAGVIENMSGFTSGDGEFHALFGSGGGERLATEIGVPLIGSIPIDPAVAAGGDAGMPIALQEDSPVAAVFMDLARRIRSEIAPPGDMASCSARLVQAVDAALSRRAG